MLGKEEEGVMGTDTSQHGLALKAFLKTEALTLSYLVDKPKST